MVFIFQDRKYKLFIQVLNILAVVTGNAVCLQMWFELQVGRALKSQRQGAVGESCNWNFWSDDCVFIFVCKEVESCWELCWEFWMFYLFGVIKARTSDPIQGGDWLLEVKEVEFPSKQLVPLGCDPPNPREQGFWPSQNCPWLPDLTFHFTSTCFFVTRLLGALSG